MGGTIPPASKGTTVKPLARTCAAALATLPAILSGGGAAAATPYPPAVETAILRALDDEQHAEAVYAATMAAFGQVRPFANIIEAERQHQAALVGLLTAAGMAVPPNAYASGEKALEALPPTLAEVCAVGVEAEIANAALYDDELLPAVAAHPEVVAVFQALRDASIDNHLPAFERCAAGGGGGRGQGHGNGHGGGGGGGHGRAGG
jgi:hypothetical protein